MMRANNLKPAGFQVGLPVVVDLRRSGLALRCFGYVASSHRYGQSPTSGRSRNARTLSSIGRIDGRVN